MERSLERWAFKVRGMDCAEEVGVLKRELAPLVGGEDNLSFDLLNARLTVKSGDKNLTLESVMRAVDRTGMKAELWSNETQDDKNRLSQRDSRAFFSAASGVLTAMGFGLHAYLSGGIREAIGSEGMGISHEIPLAVKAVYLAAIFAGALPILPKAWFSARKLRPDMNLLMTVAVIGAVAIGEWFEAATVSFLFSLSLALEAWSIGRARKAIGALMALTRPTARILNAAGEEEVPVEKVAVGTRFLVRPGEKVPIDGIIEKGISSVNQAPITGESNPLEKRPGAPVFAGTINGDGALEVRSNKLAGDTTLARIIRMVGEAHSRRTQSEQWVEKFARVYTPVVMVIAVVIFLFPPLLVGGLWQEWFYRALVLLVIACPCALVISTPVSIVASLAAAAREGVLIKDGRYVEAPAHLKAFAFDKTGTLTVGKPSVMDVIPLNGHDEKSLLERAIAMEARSDHPLAKALVNYATKRGISALPAEDFLMIQGKGATARIQGRSFWLGSHRYLEERKQETPEVHEMLEKLAESGKTVVVLGNENHVCGLISLADDVRSEARQTLSDLRSLGVVYQTMLTGDNEATAKTIAAKLELREFKAELLPEEKVSMVESMVSTYGSVAMVGDGVNDAPAMGRATIGIAMGAFGSDAAIETSDIALMSDDLRKLPWLIQHSRRTLAVIKQNIFFSLSVKAVFVILTLTGHASLWAAISADMGASFLVIFNGLRLLRPAS
jgi:Cd2+/Zn2+-exporting ATPase